MIYHQSPKNFKPRFEVVSCFLESNKDILLLRRQEGKKEGGKWGVPGGKIDVGETTIESLVREIQEETGMTIAPATITHRAKLFVRNNEYDFIYHIFHCTLPNRPMIKVRTDEHHDFRWIPPKGALAMDLVRDEDACIKLVYAL